MPWKEGYTISDEKSLPDASIRWPGGARCCVKIVVNLSVATGPAGIRPADLDSSDAYFTLAEGLESLLACLAQHSFAATFAVPAVVAQAYPEKIRKILSAGHEIAAQGLAHEDVSTLARPEEQARLQQATHILADVTGVRPAGWFALPRPGDAFAVGTISDSTMELLIDEGYTYMGNSPADDIPHYWVVDFERRKNILALPYYYHFDDQFFMMYPSRGSGLENPDFLARNWHHEFAAQHERGRYFEMTIHPKNSGWLHRLRMLDRFLAHVRTVGDVWNPTSQACADYWLRSYPAATTLQLEDSIWQDHAGSLS
ncbi:putative urate catabolism protein [Variovorax sp. PBL-H6]|uniref:polysaccharide deacetylase family protein n=1 Tax=Variovorax sp. PBL-H6 TaxID=434009 RepID=UPI001318D3B8|nr:polysaccharide deacetylase family protein [Variovorax sp. PBL-H6]VTU36774.1 putative urate catabolism protein [Variovorax sp. PBL-H6]